MHTFGTHLTALRKRAGLGLRTFAELISERSSTVSAIEWNERSPWQRHEKLCEIADVLGLVPSSDFCADLFEQARDDPHAPPPDSLRKGTLAWWWTTADAPLLEASDLCGLGEFLGLEVDESSFGAETAEAEAADLTRYPTLTELATEWRVRKLMGRRESVIAPGPVDVEAVLEREAGVRLEVVPGLIPHFSVQGCAILDRGQLTLVIDRIMADSRPLATYRELLAELFAPAALWLGDQNCVTADWYYALQHSEDWPRLMRDCQRFALSMLLPAEPVLTAAELAYREVVEQQGWVEMEAAACAVRNRLAEQFAVPPLLVHTRLVRWPCHVYGRIAQAMAAQEHTLPPVDWFLAEEPPRQRLLFEKNNR